MIQEPGIDKIIDGCRRNRRKWQKKLYEMYADAMFSTAYRMLKNRDDAQDALQDAFVEVFKHIGSFRGESTIGAWIKTIVVRKALKKLRELKFTDDLEESGPDVPVDFMDDLSGEYLEQVILSLPEGYRTVFLLCEVEGYGHKEIAGMLDISEGTSKSQLSRAKRLLRQRVKRMTLKSIYL